RRPPAGDPRRQRWQDAALWVADDRCPARRPRRLRPPARWEGRLRVSGDRQRRVTGRDDDAARLAGVLRAARETRCLEIGPALLDRTPQVFRSQFGARPAVVVADANTFAAAGRAV